MLQRGYFDHDGLRFSYLERSPDGGAGVMLMLHAHWMGASDFEEVIPLLPIGWRILALDQRGHGETSHGGAHSIDAYLSDIDALCAHRGVTRPVVLLGHSFGGMVANLYTAANPHRVRGLIMEDIDVARDDHDEFMLRWAGYYPTREALEERLGERLVPYLRKSIIHTEAGWRLTFDPEEVLSSEAALNGDHWSEWLAHVCPALVIRGSRSVPVSGEVLEEMARRRQNTRIVTIEAGHSVHIDAPNSFADAVCQFLAELQ
jgi:esterase